ncbi:hypothetical protein [Prevotella sp.]|uniref:hypothetical protein n=1 Tax=Prevotella sp. TaxID=59823 RepID=UPI003F7D696B
MRDFVKKALRNYGYRFLENQSGCYTFGKPLGYGILRADVREGENSVSVMLIVKGNVKDGKRPNQIWQRTSQGFLEEHDKQKMYEALVQAVADCEADIFYKTPVALLQNRDVRYDFEENVHIE